MFKSSITVLIPVIMAAFACTAHSQDSTRGQWSLMVQGGMNTNFGISSALQGKPDEFINELEVSGNYTKLPFGSDHSSSMAINEMLSYRLPSSNFSLYARYGITVFLYDKGIRGARIEVIGSNDITGITPNQEIISFSAISMTLGGEYTIGNRDDLFNLFCRAGMGLFFINADIEYYDFSTSSHFGMRGGLELELGGQINIQGTPIAIELSSAYVNTNLIGKSYHGSNIANIILDKPYINDDEGGGYPVKSFDYISLRAGARLYF